MITAVGCTHIARGPAADISARAVNPAPACADLFNTAFSADRLELSYEQGKFIYAEVRKYAAGQYADLIHGFMASADQASDCETQRDVELYFADIASKIGIFRGRIHKNDETAAAQAALARPEFSVQDIGTQLACYSQCAARQMQATSFARKSCRESCGTDRKLADFFDNTTDLKRLALGCFTAASGGKGGQREREAYVANYLRVVPGFLSQLAKLDASIQDELATDRRILAALNQLRGEYFKWKGTRAAKNCGPANYAWLPAAAEASVLLRSKSEEGSGFFVNTQSGRYLVTAAHVSEPKIEPAIDAKGTRGAQPMMQMILPGGKASKNVRFDIVPGMIALNGDITLAKQEKGPGLELVGQDEVPQLGQRFYVAGYPAFAGDKFQVLRCTFYGFGPRLGDGNQTEGSYLLRCPGAGDMHGISGGPMIDERGRVWGVNTVSIAYTSSLGVAPLAQNKSGEPKIGIQQVFLSDQCYTPFQYEPHRCQVMPNMYGKDVP
jgi:hypothetical protein